MDFELVLDSVDQLAEDVRACYAEAGGKFYLTTLPPGYSISKGGGDAGNLRKALQAERTRADTAEGKLKKFKLDGEELDPTEATAAVKRVREWGEKDPDADAKAQLESWKAQVTTKHARELAERDDKLRAKDEAIHHLLVDATGASACRDYDGNGNSANWDLLQPHVRALTKVVEGDDKKPVARVIDPDTREIRVSEEPGKTDHMTVAELIKWMSTQKKFMGAFEGLNAVGGGGTPVRSPSNKGGDVNPWARDTYNVTEQSKIMKADPNKAAAMKRAAGLATGTA